MDLVKKPNGYRGLPRNIYFLFIARIINSMGSFVFPFLTLFLSERLGLSPKEAGTYFMFSAISQAIGSIIGGKLTDHFGRKRLFLTFQGLTGLCFLPCGFLGNSLWIPRLIILAAMLQSAAQPVNSAMLSDLTNKDNRKQAFSLIYLGVNIGFSIGPMIAGFLYKNYTNWVFFGNAIAIFIAVTMLALFIEESMPSAEEMQCTKNIKDKESVEDGSFFKALIRRPTLIMFLVGRFLNTVVYSTIGFALPLQLTKAFGSDLGTKYFGVVMSLNGIIVITCTIMITKLTIKFKPIFAVSLASLFYAIGFGMLGFVNFFWLYVVSVIIYTIGEIIEATNAGVYLANNSPINHRGRFNSIFPLIQGAGQALGPFLFGFIIEAYGLRDLWIICFIIAIVSSGFMKWLGTYERNYEIRNKELRELVS